MLERMEEHIQHVLGMGQRVHRYPRTLQGNGLVGCPFKKAFQPPIANVLLCGAVRMQFQIKARFAVQQGCVSRRHFPAGNQFHPPLLQQFHAAKKLSGPSSKSSSPEILCSGEGYNSRQTSPLTTTGRIPWMSKS